MLAAGAALLSGCASSAAPQATNLEPYRPQLSYSPASRWMNDPNGLVYHDGEYHLFYQFNPNGNSWGDMSWGHAVGTDLVHWTELPVALAAEKNAHGDVTQMFFSGSIVVDPANTSGFGQDGKPAMVAMYTSVYPQAMTLGNGKAVRAGTQGQSLVYSIDRGRSWTQHAGNPVIELPPAPYQDEYREFRDPKVFWYEPERKWVMVAALPLRHKALLYSSTDLRNWKYMSEFGPANAIGGMWECPDLFELPVDGDPARRKWVLTMNLNPGGPAGGSGAQYFIGQFDGTAFRADGATAPTGAAAGSRAASAQPGGIVNWLDFGADFYAAVTWNGAPDGKRILVGWMSNWLYAQQVPTAPWRSAQSVARELTLRTLDGQVRLIQQPVAAFDRLRGKLLYAATGRDMQQGGAGSARLDAEGRPVDILLSFDPGTAQRSGVKVHVGANGEETVVGYDRLSGQVYIDRSKAGDGTFWPGFAARHAAPLALRDGMVKLRILVDTASVTVFAGENEVTLSDQVFPAAASSAITLFAEGGAATAQELKVWALKSIWSPLAPDPVR